MYYILASAFLYSTLVYFDDINTYSQLYQKIYYRVEVNTSWFAPGQFFCYVGLHALGYTMVALVNC